MADPYRTPDDWTVEVVQVAARDRLRIRRHRFYVNIASGAAKAPAGFPGTVPYAATKGALVTFARDLSNEVASEGIRVNSVSPGITDTDMVYPQAREAAGHTPLGRMGRPDEIADAVSWLVSPEASYVTGSDITVAGGL